MKKVALLIDGGFFIKRINYYLRNFFDNHPITAANLTDIVWSMVNFHLEGTHGRHRNQSLKELFRIYYYDCPPPSDQLTMPLKEKKEINGEMREVTVNFNMKLHPPYILANEFHTALRQNRKTALRLGVLKADKDNRWVLQSSILKDLVRGRVKWEEINNSHFNHTYRQKGVDIKLGMDITHLSYEGLVDSIVLVAGDEDFVSVAKQARIRGIDFILNPLGAAISDSLNEHIDGVQTSNMIKVIHQVCKIEPVNKPEWWEEYETRREDRKEENRRRLQGGGRKRARTR